MAEDRQKFEDYEKKVFEVDEVPGTDMKISPSYYLHFGLMACQNALRVEDMKERVWNYRMSVDHLEKLCIAADLLDESYDVAIADFKRGGEYGKDSDDVRKHFDLAKIQFRELAKRIFSNKVITAPLKA